MSNAFRTPLVDASRNLLSQVVPFFIHGSDLFSLRLQRGSVLSVVRWIKLRSTFIAAVRSNEEKGISDALRMIQDFSGGLDPRIVGSGLWFKLWSKRLRQMIVSFISHQCKTIPLVQKALITSSSFTCPLQVTVMRRLADISTDQLDVAVREFKNMSVATLLKFPKLYFHPNEVRGLSFLKRRLECHFPPSKWGQFEIRCDQNGRDFAGYIHNKEARVRILKEYYTVYNDQDYLGSVINVLKERLRFANQLGFASWTEMQTVKNLTGNCENDSLKFLTSVYMQGLPQIRSLHSKMRRSKIVEENLSLNGVDEQYLLTQWRNPTKLNDTKVFEYTKTLPRILNALEDLFQVSFTEVSHSLLIHGWHKTVKIFRVSAKGSSSRRGYIYLDLFRRRLPFSSTLNGAGPHCSVLNPSDRHVRIYMGLEPPYRSDITFQKERFFSYEEITALMHEFGHALHIILRPPGSPLSQLPMELREAVSVFCELYSLTDACVDSIAGKPISPNDKQILKRDEWFYLDIIRNVAVMETIHSTKFNPLSEGPETLKHLAKETFQQFSPFPVADYVNPLAGEVVNYLLDGESRVGYIQAYMRASEVIHSKSRSLLSDNLCKLIYTSSSPSTSVALESRKYGHAVPMRPDIDIECNQPSVNPGKRNPMASMWENCSTQAPKLSKFNK